MDLIPVDFEKELSVNLNEIEEEYSKMPDTSSKDGMDIFKARRSTIRKARTGVEAIRLKANAKAQKFIKGNNNSAKLITEKIVAIEKPYADEEKRMKDEAARVKKEKEEAEQKRKEAIVFKINEIKYHGQGCNLRELDDLEKSIAYLDRIDTSIGYDEFTETAKATLETSIIAVKEGIILATNRIEEERKRKEEQAKLDAERKAFEKEKAKAEAEKKKEADRLEAERKLEADRKAKIEEEARKKQEAEDHRLAKIKAEVEAEAKKLEDLRREKAELVAEEERKVAKAKKDEEDRILAEKELEEIAKRKEAEELQRKKDEEESKNVKPYGFSVEVIEYYRGEVPASSSREARDLIEKLMETDDRDIILNDSTMKITLL